MRSGRPLRVTHVVRQFAPAIGGFEDIVLNLARQQRARQGIEASVVTLDRLFTRPGEKLTAQDVVDDVPVRRLPWRGSSRYPLAPSVLNAIGASDIVHVHAIDFFFDYLALTAPLHRKCLIASTHGGFFHTQRAAALKRLWFRTLTRASIKAYHAIVAVSPSDAETFAPVTGSRLVSIRNGVNLAKFSAPAATPRLPRRIVTFGRMTRHKRIDRLVALLAALLRREPGWELVIVGPPGDHPVEEFLAPAVEAGITGSVHVKGPLAEAALAAEVAQASWFGSASAFEGFGLAAVEAAAGGLIPVLSEIAPFVELQAALGIGFLFDPAEPDRVVIPMTELAARLPHEQAALRARLADGVAPYGVDAAVDAHAALYRKVLDRAA